MALKFKVMASLGALPKVSEGPRTAVLAVVDTASVAPLESRYGLAWLVLPNNCSVPALIVVGPVYVLLLGIVKTPLPVFVSPRVPAPVPLRIRPENVVLVLSSPVIRRPATALKFSSVPAPVIEPIETVLPLIRKVPCGFTV